MTIIPTLPGEGSPFLVFTDLIGWVGWFFMFAGILALLWRWRRHQFPLDRTRWRAFAVLLLFQIIVTTFLGVRIVSPGSLPAPGLFASHKGLVWMVLAGLPWGIAAGVLGPYGSFFLGSLCGAILAAYDTHSLFTPLEYGFAALVIGAAVNQRYRTGIFRALANPLIIAGILIPIYPSLFVLDSILWVNAALLSEIDYALSNAGIATLVFSATLVVAGGAGLVARAFKPEAWGVQSPLEPSPAERSIETRSFYVLGPVMLVLVPALTILGWSISANAARVQIQERMRTTAELAANDIPFVLEMGQNLIIDLANDPRFRSDQETELKTFIDKSLRESPYFEDLFLIDTGGPEISVIKNGPSITLTSDEISGIDLAMAGVPFQYYTGIPTADEGVVISFISGISGNDRVLIGRSSLETNPFTETILSSLAGLKDVGGVGVLVDERGSILYHPVGDLILTQYAGDLSVEEQFFDETGPTGTRNLVYVQPAWGRSWMVVVLVSAQNIQQVALTIAAPLLGLLLALSILLAILLRLVLRVVAGSLRNLAREASLIAHDRTMLANPLPTTGEDEVGQMRRAFEKMRESLKARMDEQEQLLLVSHWAASTLEIELSLDPILTAALTNGAICARVVLSSEAIPELNRETPSKFGRGLLEEHYAFLDRTILNQSQIESPLIRETPAAVRTLEMEPGSPVPAALLAVALRVEGSYLGALWIAYNESRVFHEDEIRYMTTLAGQAASASANARLFMSSEIGRQRLAAILASTPDPVLVIDHENRLILANPAAWQVLANGKEAPSGTPIEDAFNGSKILKFLQEYRGDQSSAEIELADKQVYLARTTSVRADQASVGRVCVLRDISKLKEADNMRQELMHTVSHDLRGPLQAIKGHTMMMELIGDLSEAQKLHLKKIDLRVESMAQMVNDLLDLDRIEAGGDLIVEFFPIIEAIERALAPLEFLAMEKNISLTKSLPNHDNPLIRADQTLFERAIQNLVENAIKYTPNGGLVSVNMNLSEDRSRVFIMVEDTGIGIDPKEYDRLFEKFYRIQRKDVPSQRGSGLGLSIVKSIVDHHGGEVRVRSRINQGSTFTVELPL